MAVPAGGACRGRGLLYGFSLQGGDTNTWVRTLARCIMGVRVFEGKDSDQQGIIDVVALFVSIARVNINLLLEFWYGFDLSLGMSSACVWTPPGVDHG